MLIRQRAQGMGHRALYYGLCTSAENAIARTMVLKTKTMLARRIILICFMLIGFIHMMYPNFAAAQRVIKYDTLMKV